jgi:hypothetical protein
MAKQNPTDTLTQMRQYLIGKPAEELVDLLIDLLQQIDETTRRRFWEQLAPPGLATADLHYPSSEAFLADVKAFVTAAADGEYYEQEAADYFGEDPADRDYHVQKGYIDEYDITYHMGMSKLKGLLEAAGSYYEAGCFDVAADAYEELLGLLLPDRSYDLFGVDSPLIELGFDDRQLVEQLFVALRQSSETHSESFAVRSLAFLEACSGGWQDFPQYLIRSCQTDSTQEAVVVLRRYLEEQTMELDTSPPPDGEWPVPPLSLELLIRLIRALNGPEAAVELCARFRLRYPDLYMPLLEGCTTREAWPELLRFGAEALALPPRPRGGRYPYGDQLPNLAPGVVRTRMAWAQQQLGDLPAAFAYRRTVFEESARFEDYLAALDLARQQDEATALKYMTEVVAQLQQQTNRRPLLCQIYLHSGRYESAFGVVENLCGYDALTELKLVAKAHLLSVLRDGPVSGEYLPGIRTDLGDGPIQDEYARFLRDHLPMPDLTSPQRALHTRRAERLYRNILETHIMAGSKRYEIAAYYCALLAEIAVYAEHVEEFVEWYEGLLGRHSRRRSLRRILDAKTRPVLDRAVRP